MSTRQTARNLYKRTVLTVACSILMGAVIARSSIAEPPKGVMTVAAMSESSRSLFAISMDLGDEAWDSSKHLIATEHLDALAKTTGQFMVRESAWYAYGLLMRHGPGDRERALSTISAVLAEQYTTPGVRWYGTYRRSPEELAPLSDAVMWKAYDPNWREFIGCTFALILLDYRPAIPRGVADQMYLAMHRAMDGELKEGRLLPSYSNIALLYGFLWHFTAAHYHQTSSLHRAALWTNAVYKLYKQHDAFSEYNSPTYYGVDMFALALWRKHGGTAPMRTQGEEMETTLWRNISSLYQPEMRNMSGPYDRAYGMDMQSYVSLVGVWLRTEIDADRAPLPTLDSHTNHIADIWFAPQFISLGANIPQDVRPAFSKFVGNHFVKSRISEERTMSAWIGNDVIYGGEATGMTKSAPVGSQFHPATIHWRLPSGQIGWVELLQCPAVDVNADDRGLHIVSKGDIHLRLYAPQLNIQSLRNTEWILPGLSIRVESDAGSFMATQDGATFNLVYQGMTYMRLHIRDNSNASTARIESDLSVTSKRHIHVVP